MAVLEFVNRGNKTLTGLKKSIDYITQPSKTEPHLMYGKDCNSDNAYMEMKAIKHSYNKMTGRQFIHFIQSFATWENVSADTVHEVGQKLLENPVFDGFQVVMATHTDKDHLHNHFIINTANYETGYKWQQNPKQLQELKNYSDTIIRDYGLTVTHGKNNNHMKSGEYRSLVKVKSWKHELEKTIEICKYNSISRQNFITNMEAFGYKVKWTDTRKYITFTTPSGKRCRDNKLSEDYSKEAIERRLGFNDNLGNHQNMKNTVDGWLTAISNLLSNNNHTNAKGYYPLSSIEYKDMIANMKRNSGLDWDNQQNYEDEYEL
jgi:hypothetical protein